MTTSPTQRDADKLVGIQTPKVRIDVDTLLDRAIGMAHADAAAHIKTAASASLTNEGLIEQLRAVLSENARLRTWVALHDGDAEAVAEGRAETAVPADQLGSPDRGGPQAHASAEPEPKP